MKDANKKYPFFPPIITVLCNTSVSSRQPWKHLPCNHFIIQIKPSNLKSLSLQVIKKFFQSFVDNKTLRHTRKKNPTILEEKKNRER